MSLVPRALLGVLLIVLAEGSWVRMLMSGPFDYVRLKSLFEFSPLGLFTRATCLAAICLVWQSSVRHSRRRLGRFLGAAAWVATFGLAGWYALAYVSFARGVSRNIDEVFIEAKRDPSSQPWIGVFGSSHLCGHLVAIAPSGRFGQEAWCCSGTIDLAWGHVVHEGPYVRLIYEEKGPFKLLSGWSSSDWRYLPISGDLYRLDKLQVGVMGEGYDATLYAHILDIRPDERVVAFRRSYDRILAGGPVVAHVRCSMWERPTLREGPYKGLLRGVLDIGTKEGVGVGMAFCSFDASKSAHYLVITSVRENESDFVDDYDDVAELAPDTPFELCKRFPWSMPLPK